MIECDRVGKSYRRVTIGPISFAVEPGTIVALVGPNGSGKSTTIYRMLELRNGSGTCRFGGLRISELDKPAAVVGVVLMVCQHMRAELLLGSCV